MIKTNKKYFIKKEIFACSLQEALKKERQAHILEVYEEVPKEPLPPVGFV